MAEDKERTGGGRAGWQWRMTEEDGRMKIGEVITAAGPVIINAGKKTVQVTVANLGDRPVQVGSHYHFFEVNRCLAFEREKAFGFRLDIPSGTSVRFEPGEEKTVQLVELGGRRRVYGLNDLTRDTAVQEHLEQALACAGRKGFLAEQTETGEEAADR